MIYNGYLKVPTDDKYVFHLTGDHELLLYVDGKFAASVTSSGQKRASKEFDFKKEYVPFYLQYIQDTKTANMSLSIESSKIRKPEV
ncbi:MAG: PA14 domain-containing protein [Lentisphaerales bacterium]|nr:PA14 domain-containing protein [Lentisphaerales bacterium]